MVRTENCRITQDKQTASQNKKINANTDNTVTLPQPPITTTRSNCNGCSLHHVYHRVQRWQRNLTPNQCGRCWDDCTCSLSLSACFTYANTCGGNYSSSRSICFPPLCVLASNRAKKTQQLVVRARSVHSWSQRKWKETLYPMSISPQLTKRSDALYDGYRTLIGIPLQRAITMLLVQLGCCSYCCSRGLQFDCL